MELATASMTPILFAVNRRGKCPTCGSPNLHAFMAREELAAELRNPTIMVKCRVCPDVFVLPNWAAAVQEQSAADAQMVEEFRVMFETLAINMETGMRSFAEEAQRAAEAFTRLGQVMASVRRPEDGRRETKRLTDVG